MGAERDFAILCVEAMEVNGRQEAHAYGAVDECACQKGFRKESEKAFCGAWPSGGLFISPMLYEAQATREAKSCGEAVLALLWEKCARNRHVIISQRQAAQQQSASSRPGEGHEQKQAQKEGDRQMRMGTGNVWNGHQREA